MQGSSQGGKTRKERAEVCHHAKELLKLCDVGWCGQGMYSINLLWNGLDSRFIIEAFKEFHHWHLTCVFLGLNTKPYFQTTSMSFHRWASLGSDIISNLNATFTFFQYLILFTETLWSRRDQKEDVRSDIDHIGH